MVAVTSIARWPGAGGRDKSARWYRFCISERLGELDMAGPRKVASTREPGRAFDILEPEAGVPDVYVDEFAGIIFSSSVAKVGLYLSATPVQENDVTVERQLVNVATHNAHCRLRGDVRFGSDVYKSNSTLIEQALNEQTQKIMLLCRGSSIQQR